jgi:hypothetical protein
MPSVSSRSVEPQQAPARRTPPTISTIPLPGADPESRYQPAPLRFWQRIFERLRLGFLGRRNRRNYSP